MVGTPAITFGLRPYGSLSCEQFERWDMARHRILVGNIPARWAPSPPGGKALSAKQARAAGLGVPETVWHSSRDRVAE
jgi:hypothetical protein